MLKEWQILATFNRFVPAVNQVETHILWQQYELHGWRNIIFSMKQLKKFYENKSMWAEYNSMIVQYAMEE